MHHDFQHVIIQIFGQDLKGSVEKIAKFLGKSLSPDVTEKIAEHCVFKSMKQNKMSNFSMVPEEYMDQKKSEFLRKGNASTLLKIVGRNGEKSDKTLNI